MVNWNERDQVTLHSWVSGPIRAGAVIGKTPLENKAIESSARLLSLIERSYAAFAVASGTSTGCSLGNNTDAIPGQCEIGLRFFPLGQVWSAPMESGRESIFERTVLSVLD